MIMYLSYINHWSTISGFQKLWQSFTILSADTISSSIFLFLKRSLFWRDIGDPGRITGGALHSDTWQLLAMHGILVNITGISIAKDLEDSQN